MKTFAQIVTVIVAVSLFTGFAFATSLTDVQKHHMDKYLTDKGLNLYGDPTGTMYAGGSPLFDEQTGANRDRYEYLLAKFPRILDDLVSIQPVDGVARILSSAKLVNDVDATRLNDRALNALVNLEAENARLIDSIRAAVDARDFKAISQLLTVLNGMDTEHLKVFVPVLRDARRMLQGPTILPVDVTSQVRDLLATTATLIARAQA